MSQVFLFQLRFLLVSAYVVIHLQYNNMCVYYAHVHLLSILALFSQTRQKNDENNVRSVLKKNRKSVQFPDAYVCTNVKQCMSINGTCICSSSKYGHRQLTIVLVLWHVWKSSTIVARHKGLDSECLHHDFLK